VDGRLCRGRGGGALSTRRQARQDACAVLPPGSWPEQSARWLPGAGRAGSGRTSTPSPTPTTPTEAPVSQDLTAKRLGGAPKTLYGQPGRPLPPDRAPGPGPGTAALSSVPPCRAMPPRRRSRRPRGPSCAVMVLDGRGEADVLPRREGGRRRDRGPGRPAAAPFRWGSCTRG